MIMDPTFYAHLPVLHALGCRILSRRGHRPADHAERRILDGVPADARAGRFRSGDRESEPELSSTSSTPGSTSCCWPAWVAATSAGTIASWLLVRQDLWDAKTIVQPADLKGKLVDGANIGSPIDFLLKETLTAGGLTPADAHVSEHYRSIANWLEALRTTHAVDVARRQPEPAASQPRGPRRRAFRWISFFPRSCRGYQQEYIGASATFAKAHPDLLRALLARVRARQRRHLEEQRQMDAGTSRRGRPNGRSSRPMSYADSRVRSIRTAHGEVDLDALSRMQQFWVSEKLVTTPVDVRNVADTTLLHEVQRELHF